MLYAEKKLYEPALACFERALAIRRSCLGPKHLETVPGLVNLGNLLGRHGKYQRAKVLLTEALTIWEKSLHPDDPRLRHLRVALYCLYEEMNDARESELQARRLQDDFPGFPAPEGWPSLQPEMHFGSPTFQTAV